MRGQSHMNEMDVNETYHASYTHVPKRTLNIEQTIARRANHRMH